MNKVWASRIGAVVILAVLIAVWIVPREHARAALLAAPAGAAQAQYLTFLQHASFGRSFAAALIGGLVYVLLVEVLAYVLRGEWRRQSSGATPA